MISKVKAFLHQFKKHKHSYVFASRLVERQGKYKFKVHVMRCQHCHKTKRIAV